MHSIVVSALTHTTQRSSVGYKTNDNVMEYDLMFAFHQYPIDYASPLSYADAAGSSATKLCYSTCILCDNDIT